MSTEVERSPDWWEALTEGQPVLLAFVKIDRAGATEEWRELPEPRARERRRGYTAGVEYVARSCGAAQPLHWQGDGVMLFFADGDEPAPVQAFQAAKALWERIRVDLNLTARIAVHAGLIPWHPDTGQLASPALDLCGHLEAAAPPDSIVLTEDVYLLLPEAAKRQCAALGITQRDGLPAHVFPAAAAAKRDPQKFSDSGDLALWESFRQYARSAEIAKLRYVGLRLVRKEPPCLDIEKVFVPLEVERPERRLALTRSAMEAARRARRKPAEPSQQPPFSRLDFETETSVPEPFAEVFRRNRSLVVLGEPGSGKSTLLRWLAVVAAQGPLAVGKALGVAERLLPIPVSVGRLAEIRKSLGDTASVLDAIGHYLHSRNLGAASVLAEFIHARLTAGEGLVLLDGLDEVGAGEREAVRAWLETFASAYPRSRFVVSSRRVGYVGFQLPDGQEVSIQPFSDQQVQAYVRAFCRAYYRWETGWDDDLEPAAEAEKLLSAIRENPRLAGLARNPFLLSAMALIHRAEGRLPRHRVQFYEIFMRCLCESWGAARRLVAGSAGKDIPYEEEALPIFGDLALRMHQEHPSGLALREYVVSVLADVLQRKRGVESSEARRAAEQFLQREGEDVQVFLERGTDEWGFLHLTFHEFFAAAGLLAEERFEEVAKEHLFDPRWEEVIRLGVGYMALIQKRPKQVSRFIEDVVKAKCGTRAWITKDLQLQIPLAALFAAEAGDTLDAQLQRTVADRFGEWALRFADSRLVRVRIRELSMTDFRTAIAMPFMAALKQKGRSVRQTAALALGGLKAEAAVPALLAALTDPDPSARTYAALALVWVKAEQAIPALLAALRDEDSAVGITAAIALRGLNMGGAPPGLLTTLTDENPFVRWNAVVALGALKAEAAVPALLATLRDKDPLVCASAAQTLGTLKAQQAIPGLLGALDHEDHMVRVSVAEALGELKVEAAIPALLAAMGDVSVSVRTGAASALGRLKAQVAVPALLPVLRDKDGFVRAAAAEALGALKAEAAIPALLAALKDKEGSVRAAAAEALGALRAEAAMASLLAAMKDENSDVRGRAAEALGMLKADAAIPALLSALKDDNSYVRGRAAQALGALKVEHAIPSLLAALQDEDRHVRARTADALSMFLDLTG